MNDELVVVLIESEEFGLQIQKVDNAERGEEIFNNLKEIVGARMGRVTLLVFDFSKQDQTFKTKELPQRIKSLSKHGHILGEGEKEAPSFIKRVKNYFSSRKIRRKLK